MVVTEGNGLPLGLVVEDAHAAEITLAPATMQSIQVRTKGKNTKTRPHQLVADRGFDSRAFRKSLQKRGIKVCIPPRRRHPSWKKRKGRPLSYDKEAYKSRYKVERCFAWLNNYRRILIRWEHHLPIYRAFCLFALALICLNRLLI
jgi:transposase